ncbi:MAG: alpha/beta fold hydrolase [Deltaproteobacteria bacterium]|nr:alpha/beta fold hydrolase [Deltaproteobacteria bacterium]
MKLFLKTHNGKPEMPVIVLIHGLGMNNYFWVNPEKCLVLGGLAPLTIFLSSERAKTDNTISFGSAEPHIEGLWNCLKREGYSLISWTQSQPLGPVQIAVDELKTSLDRARHKWPGRAIYLVGHSRGGLIARRFLAAENAEDVAGLITICSPHSGTSMAKFSRYLKPAGVLLEKILPTRSKATLTQALSRLSAFFQSPAIAELEPDSDFMASLPKRLPQHIAKLSFGGTNPALFHVIVRLPSDNHKVIKFPDLLAGAIPPGHMPREMTPGLGDALVSADSAYLPGSRHYDVSANHVKAAYDSSIHEVILDFLKT